MYCTITEATDYLTSIGINELIGDETLLNQVITRASYQLDSMYGHLYPGIVWSDTQSFLWPRSPAIDKSGRVIAGNTIPAEIKRATALLAQALYHSKDLSTNNQSVKSATVKVGPITEATEYFGTSKTTKSDHLVNIEMALAPLLGKVSGARVIYMDRG